MGRRAEQRVQTRARGKATRPTGSVGGDVHRCSRRGVRTTARRQGARDHQLPGVHQGVVTNAVRLGEDALGYVDVLHNFARYLSGTSADAEDLVQETYARALQAADQFTTGTNLKA